MLVYDSVIASSTELKVLRPIMACKVIKMSSRIEIRKTSRGLQLIAITIKFCWIAAFPFTRLPVLAINGNNCKWIGLIRHQK